MTIITENAENAVTFQTLGDSALRAEIEIKASPDKVYAAWTRPERFVKWFGPRSGGSLQIDQFDCHVGGKFDVTMLFADGDRVQMIGMYQTLDAPVKIVLTWQWRESTTLSNETLVTVDLLPTATGTLLTLTHERFASAGARDDHQEGWGPLLAHLAAILTD